jgi:hypothetical protein
MSQYPSPYSPPPYPQNAGYYNPYGFDPRGPAKRAGLLMIIVGAIATLFALCMVGVTQILRTTTLPPELAAQMHQMESNGVTAAAIFMTMGVAFFIFAVLEIVLGLFVRTGNTVAIGLSLIGTAVVLVIFAVFVLVGTANALMHAPQAVAGLMIWLVPLALLVLQLIWLITAIRAAPRMAMAQQQYQAQLWQYQQNIQAYGGYGQALSPPPPPPKPEENAER